MVITRRAFLQVTAGGTLTVVSACGGSATRDASRPAHGGAGRRQGGPAKSGEHQQGRLLAVEDIEKFVTPLLVPPRMPRSTRRRGPDGRWMDCYEISVRQFEQQVLPEGMPMTTVWGYGPRGEQGMHHFPSYTVEADQGRWVQIRWVNELVDDNGEFLPHLLPVDPTLHWANPERLPARGGVAETDMRPELVGRRYVRPRDLQDPESEYTQYAGPVPLIAHLHGAMGVGDESDGYTEAWTLPDASNLPAGIARHGRWYEFLADKAKRRFGVEWQPGEQISHYPNLNRACTMWFHDHALGLTRLNVYAGPAGFYLLRGGPGSERDIRDRRTGRRAVLPTGRREIPVVVQDRAFHQDGSLFYPDSRAFFDQVDGPFIPRTDVSPVWNPEFFGNTLVVNGNTWPHLDVERRRYRMRMLNGCQSRALILDFSGIDGVAVWQIGNEGGLLDRPVDVSGKRSGQVLLAPAERADLLVDFTGVAEGEHVLRNVGPDEPYGGGHFPPADPGGTGQVMQFRVRGAKVSDETTPPERMRLPRVPRLPQEDRTRRIALLEEMSRDFPDSPVEAAIGVVRGDPRRRAAKAEKLEWSSPVTESPREGECEVWEIYNLTADAHPIHLHEVAFEVLDRQPVEIDAMKRTVRIRRGAPRRPPEPGETGRKDTVIAYPGHVTRLRARFTMAGQYVYHCHILEHEDNEMMRPVRVGPLQPGQPPDVRGAHDH